jgi:Ca-activated chloride channel family protein
LTYFATATTGLSVSLLVDSSASMEDQMIPAQKAASDFVARLRPGDVAQIVDFDSRVQILQPFTADQTALQAAIQRLAAGGSTSLFNAVYVSLRELDTLRASTADQVRREVIIVLSDGEDTSSLVEFDQVMDLARRSQTVIYTIALGAANEPARVTKPMSGDFALRRMAVETGGRMFTTKEAMGLAGVYSRIAEELTSQYVLGYLSTNGQPDGRWRQLSVRVAQPNLRARTRTGYFASASSGRP